MDMLDLILKVLPIASFLLAVLTYITNEMRARRKEREEKRQNLEANKNGALPPRKETHRKK